MDEDDLSTHVPEKYQERFGSLIREMETDIGITVHVRVQFDGKNLTEVYPFEKRNIILVVSMDEKYKELDGEYESLDAFTHRIDVYNTEHQLVGDSKLLLSDQIVGVPCGLLCGNFLLKRVGGFKIVYR